MGPSPRLHAYIPTSGQPVLVGRRPLHSASVMDFVAITTFVVGIRPGNVFAGVVHASPASTFPSKVKRAGEGGKTLGPKSLSRARFRSGRWGSAEGVRGACS